MAFKYINPGYVALLDKTHQATQVIDPTRSKIGLGFCQTSYSGRNIPLKTISGNNLWFKFDVYIPSLNTAIYLNLPYKSYLGVMFKFSSDNNTRIVFGKVIPTINTDKSSANTSNVEWGIVYDSINTFLIHVAYNGENSSVEIITPNNSIITFSSINLSYESNISPNGLLYSSSTNLIFSNIIVSDEYISLKEQMIALPVSQTITNMTAGASGIYIADAANQQLLQSVDVASLIENFGASSAITGIALVGNPAYKTAVGLAKLTALSKAGGSITEHDTFALSGDSTAMIMDSWGLSSVNISNLQDMQFGWKVEE